MIRRSPYDRVVTTRVTTSQQICVGHGHLETALVTPVGSGGNTQVVVYDSVGEIAGREIVDLRSSKVAHQEQHMRPYREGLYVKLSADGPNIMAADYSVDLTKWIKLNTPITTPSTVEDDDAAKVEYLRYTIAAADATLYTWTLLVLKDAVVAATRFPMFYARILGSFIVTMDTSSGALVDNNHAIGGTPTAELIGAYWKLSIPFTTDDGNGIQFQIYPAAGANANQWTQSAGALGEITISEQSVTTPGGEGSVLLRYIPLKA